MKAASRSCAAIACSCDNHVNSGHFVANGQGYGSATVQHFVVEVAAVAHREWSPCASL